MDSKERGFRFSIDRGGTFTDIYTECPNGKLRVMKLLSEDPAHYSDAPTEAIRRILEEETGVSYPADRPINTSQIEFIRMGTTVATNALLERKGAKMALVITQGFRDLLHIGNQSRPNLFDLEIVTPDVLYEEVVEVRERAYLANDQCQLRKDLKVVTGTTEEKIEIAQPIDVEKLKVDLQALLDKGIKNLAVVLMHSYTFDSHELEIGKVAKEMGFEHVSLSSEAMPMVRIVPRGYTACADAYLTPCIKEYVKGFSNGFNKELKDVRVLFMQSDGGLTPVEKFIGSRAILSGPAGGVVGYGLTTYEQETKQPVIGFDMGGTSTDVSRYAGHYEHVFETTTAGVSIQAPQLDINTVAAGGGSRLFFRAGMFVVGPESAGAHPGPVCYRKGGFLAVTDANLVLGRILSEYFPKIFGETKDLPLDKEAALRAFEKLKEEVNKFRATQEDKGKANEPLTTEEVAMGFITVANEAMCRPIRALTQAKGYDTAKHVLATFGGAGGQHACAIAASLGMSKIFIHKYSGILSAYGLALADVVHEAQEPCADRYEEGNFKHIDHRLDVLTEQCREELRKQGFSENVGFISVGAIGQSDKISTEPFLHLRYDGTDCALMCSVEDNKVSGSGSRHGDFEQAFLHRYKREFGFTIPDRPIIVDDIRVRGTGRSGVTLKTEVEPASGPPKVEKVCQCYFEGGFQETKVYLMDDLSYGHVISGPAIIMEQNSTILVEPGCDASITKHGDVMIEILSRKTKHEIGEELDSIQLSIFSHRFMSTAEQMGRVLQRTSISTNIKERLDFSCAMFGPDGGLVANAPHIPVHLGAMQETVKYQIKTLGDSLKEGDVILSNHPSAGGSHLPDLTVITPVFYKGEERPVFFVASRGHHADIGGITPGSMPPHSKTIFEEGAVFKSFKLVSNGVFQEEELKEALMAPAKYPGSSGTRNLHDNLSDLRAQVAANHKGIQLIKDLIDEYGLNVVQAYMHHIQINAELAVREMLKEIALKTKERTGKTVLTATDHMDDGTPINLKVSINENEGSAVVDFTGTGPEVYGNCNAPRAVTLSALIYCLRCMVAHDVPLNQGCLIPVTVITPRGSMLNPSKTAAVIGGNTLTCQRVVDVVFKAFDICAASQGCLAPIEVIIPKGSIIDPSETAAVVGGNILTCQRVVDVVFSAFQVCAASQGCMNNVTFGDQDMGYYETVAGGAGAGPSWHGRSGVHCHMTNTRITDPEILERRYPVILRRFELNQGTGGKGMFNGGDGVIRELLFRKPLTLSVLTERRAFRPYGLKGGLPGKRGKNLLYKNDGRVINLMGKTSLNIETGDVFRLESPGGGGYGTPDQTNLNEDDYLENGEFLPIDVGRRSPPLKRRKTDTDKYFVEKGSVFEYRKMQESV